jgi:hypothetical protein
LLIAHVAAAADPSIPTIIASAELVASNAPRNSTFFTPPPRD